MKRLILNIFFVTASFSTEKITYQFSQDPIDIVFVCHEKDADSLSLAIDGIKKYIDHRTIYVISEKPFTDQAQWIDESIFPFTKKDIVFEIFGDDQDGALKYLAHEKNRSGWIYQQFCKMYSLFVIPGISENVLVVDADTVFLQKVRFMNATGAPLFNVGTEYHKPYFAHINRLIPWLKKVYPSKSGITHHMLFQKCVMQDLFAEIERIHGLEVWRAISRLIDHEHLFGSALSEYELYFNFIFSRTDQAKIRRLSWANYMRSNRVSFSQLKQSNHYIAWHKYIN